MARFRMVLALGLGLSMAATPALAQGYGYGNPAAGSLIPGIDDQMLGRLGGAAVGALLGSQIGKGGGNLLAIGAGGLLGYFAGGFLMDRLGPRSLEAAQTAEMQALEAPVGQRIRWNSPEGNGIRGTVEPVRDGRDAQGRECREVLHTVFVEGKRETATGVACRGSDGRWQIAEDSAR